MLPAQTAAGSSAFANVAGDGLSLAVPAAASLVVLDVGVPVLGELVDSVRPGSIAVACVDVREEVAAEPVGLGGGAAGAEIAASNACIRGGALEEVSSDESSAGFAFAPFGSSGSVEAVAVEALVAAPALGVSELSSCESKSSSVAESFAALDCCACSDAGVFEAFGCEAALGFGCGRARLDALEVAASAVPSEEVLPCPAPPADGAECVDDADCVDEAGACGAALRAPEPASSVNVADVALAPAELFAPPVWLAAPEAAGLTLSAGIEASRRAALCALVRFALLLTVLRPQFLALAPFDDTIDHLGMPGRVLPVRAIRVALGARTAHDLSLLLDGLGEAGEEGLKLTQPGPAHPVGGPARELTRVVRFVALELLQLGFTFPDTTFACRERLGALPLLLVRYFLRRP